MGHFSVEISRPPGSVLSGNQHPEAYIAATLRKILDNHMQRDIAELMPWNFSE